MVALEDLIDVGREPSDVASHFLTCLVGKCLREQPDIVTPHAQRWHVDPHHIDSVIEVSAKAALLHHAGDVAGCGSHHTHVDCVVLPGAHPSYPALLQHPQQLGLERKRQFPHFVKKEGAPVGKLHQADSLRIGPREGAPLMPKQFALQQGVWNRAAVDRNKRPGRPAAASMKGPGHQLLAGAGLARHQHIHGA